MKSIALGVRNFVNGLGVTGSSALSNYPKFQLLLTSGVLDRRVDFSRTSNATITNSAGSIAYAPHNLLTYSEQFDNAAWTKSNSSIVANAIVAPDGTTTADKIIETAVAATEHNIYQSISFTAGISYVISIYAKAAERSILKIAPGINDTTFDLSNGTITAGVGGTITAVDNGWYRCIWTGTAVSTGSAARQIKMVTPSSGDSTSGLYIWGAKLEIGTTATVYNSTTVKNLLGYSELFDNAAWTKSNSFVQTNLLTYSEDFTNAAWAKTTVTATANSIAAPNGYQTADTLSATGANSTALQTFTASAVPYTYSVYLYRKTGTGNIDISVDGTTWVTKAITAGWTRVDTTLTPAAGAKTAGIRIATNGDEVYSWGAQLVQGSTAGDYRRTDAATLPIYYANHNGVVCAEKLVETATTAFHNIFWLRTCVIGEVLTRSFYLKAGERTWAGIYVQDGVGGDFFTYINLATGQLGNVGAGCTATVQSVGNGWYRLGITRTVTSSTANQSTVSVFPTTGNNVYSYTGDGTSGIYIFGAQLSDSASLDTYVLNAAAAPTAAAYYGPRFDYDPVTLQPKGLLIEEQRQNLVLNSTLDGANLATQNVTVTAVAHTISFYGTGQIVLSGTASATVTGTGAYPTRKTLTFTPTAGTLTLTVTGTVQYAQLETGSFATSYIPTGASQATRTADVATIQGSNFYSWFGTNEASITATFDSPASGNRNALSIDDNTANNYLQLRTETADPFFRQKWTGTEQVALDLGTITANTMNKAGYGFKVNDYAAVINGGTVGTDTSASTIIADRMRIGTSQAGEYLNGHVKSVACYSTRNTDATLKGLTA